jgi:D-3-phosphoglycerate dehydrogenase
MVQNQKAINRLNRIVGSVVPASCEGKIKSLASAEGAAFARWSGAKITILASLDNLAEQKVVNKTFEERGLEAIWCSSPDHIPEDSQILVTTSTPVTADMLRKAPKLKLVAIAFSGVDHVNVFYCMMNGIQVVNVPGYSSEATAELAIALMLSHLRRLPTCFKEVHAGSLSAPPQETLQSKKLGIVGTGQIGLRVAMFAKAFGMKSIVGFDIEPKEAFALAGGVYTRSLASLFLESDIICICVPLNDKTRGLISKDLMSLLRRDSLLVNVARSGVVDQVALVAHLKAGKFRAALDNFDTRVAAFDELRSVPQENLLMTPHIGYQAQESLAKRFDITVKNIFAFLADEPVNLVEVGGVNL